MRVGFGYDVHKLEEGQILLIGGVKISHYKGSVAHSDGDVLIHAICDALLGASNLRDIGFHFPDSDEQFRGIDSGVLLEKVVKLVRNKGLEISNIDSTVILQKPKVSSYIPEMKVNLAKILNIEEDQISIKATSTEKLGFEGKEEGIGANAIVLLKNNDL